MYPPCYRVSLAVFFWCHSSFKIGVREVLIPELRVRIASASAPAELTSSMHVRSWRYSTLTRLSQWWNVCDLNAKLGDRNLRKTKILNYDQRRSSRSLISNTCVKYLQHLAKAFDSYESCSICWDVTGAGFVWSPFAWYLRQHVRLNQLLTILTNRLGSLFFSRPCYNHALAVCAG